MFYENKLSVNNDVLTYGQGVEFASVMFNFLNGRINPVLPAKYLLVGKCQASSDRSTVGDNIGDIVQIDIHEILRTCIYDRPGDQKEKSDRFKGFIIYCLIHELLHMEQDIAKYYTFGFDEEITEVLIEESCHCATSCIFNQLVDSNILQLEFDPPITFEVPSLTNFISWSSEKESYDRMVQAYNSYYKITNQYQKVLWLMNSLLFPNPYHYSTSEAFQLQEYIDSGYSNILLEITVNDRIYKTGYLVYLNYLQPATEIMNMLDIMVLMQKQGHNAISLQHLTNPNFPKLILLRVEYKGDNLIDIVNQIPSSEFPIPPIR